MRGRQGPWVTAGTAVAAHLDLPFCGLLHLPTPATALCFSDGFGVLLHTLMVCENLDGEHRASRGLCVLGAE